MHEASQHDITKFLQCQRIAVVGVSRKPQHFSRAVLREFLAARYDAVPVNSQATEIEGRKCFGRLGDVLPPADATLLLIAAPEATDQALRECQEAGIRNIWIYKSINRNEGHARAKALCRSEGVSVIEGYCPLMFLPHGAFIHRAHGFFMKLAGAYPRPQHPPAQQPQP
jgi:uncharacterized protein